MKYVTTISALTILFLIGIGCREDRANTSSCEAEINSQDLAIMRTLFDKSTGGIPRDFELIISHFDSIYPLDPCYPLPLYYPPNFEEIRDTLITPDFSYRNELGGMNGRLPVVYMTCDSSGNNIYDIAVYKRYGYSDELYNFGGSLVANYIITELDSGHLSINLDILMSNLAIYPKLNIEECYYLDLLSVDEEIIINKDDYSISYPQTIPLSLKYRIMTRDNPAALPNTSFMDSILLE